MADGSSPGERHWPALVVLLAFGAALRLLYLNTPYVDAHGWRQIDTAAIARNFSEGSLNPFYPRVDWGGAEGIVESEFPLVPWILACLSRVLGFHDWLGRLLGIAFSLGLIVATYWLAFRLEGRASFARAAALLMAFSPAAVFFGRTVMPDTPMLLFVVLSMSAFVAFAGGGPRRHLWAGAAWLALACLVKLPAIVAGLPVVVVLLYHRGLTVLRDWRVALTGAVALLVVGAWYWHASRIYAETGLTFGILGAPAKTYPSWISPGPWPSVFSKWSTLELLRDPAFYERMFARLYHFHLTPIALVCAAIGACLWRAPGRVLVHGWLAAMVLFILVAGEGHRAHDYYQLPFVAIAALYFAVVVWPLLDVPWLRARGIGATGRLALWSVMGLLAVTAFYYSGVTQTHFRSNGLDTRTLQAAGAVDAVTHDGSLAIVVDDYGITSPILFYYAHLKGWSFDVGDVSPRVIETLRGMRARYFVTTRWGALAAERPEAAQHLRYFTEMSVPGAPADVKVFELH